MAKNFPDPAPLGRPPASTMISKRLGIPCTGKATTWLTWLGPPLIARLGSPDRSKPLSVSRPTTRPLIHRSKASPRIPTATSIRWLSNKTATQFALSQKRNRRRHQLHQSGRARRDGKVATSLPVLRECGDEALRTLRLSTRPRVSLGRAGVHRRDRVDRFFGRSVARPVRAVVAARSDAALARSDSFAGICRPPDVSHAGRSRPLAAIPPDIRRLGGQERARRQAAGAHSRYFAVGADPRFHFRDGRVLHVPGSGTGARRRIRGHLCHIHQPSLEHGLQLLSVAAHDSDL